MVARTLQRGGAFALVAALMTVWHAWAQQTPSPVSAPYVRTPAAQEQVRFDGTLGGAKTAWAYPDRTWLEEYLRITIDAAAANAPYSEVSKKFDRLAGHVVQLSNGTRATVEEVRPFSYGGRTDAEVRALVTEGPQRGRELWTTCGELVDDAGHSFVRI
jgi:hypothetical protein